MDESSKDQEGYPMKEGWEGSETKRRMKDRSQLVLTLGALVVAAWGGLLAGQFFEGEDQIPKSSGFPEMEITPSCVQSGEPGSFVISIDIRYKSAYSHTAAKGFPRVHDLESYRLPGVAIFAAPQSGEVFFAGQEGLARQEMTSGEGSGAPANRAAEKWLRSHSRIRAVGPATGPYSPPSLSGRGRIRFDWKDGNGKFPISVAFYDLDRTGVIATESVTC